MSALIHHLLMKSHFGELLISLQPNPSLSWKLEIYARDEAGLWEWTAGGNGHHHHLLRIGISYAVGRLGSQAVPVEIG